MSDAPVEAPAEVSVTPGSSASRWISLGLGIALVTASVVNTAATLGFPSNAPVEWLMSAFICASLFVGAVALIVLGIVWRRPAVPVTRVSVWSILALAIAGIALIGWLLTTGIARVTGEPLRYMIDAGFPMLSSWPWLFAIVAGVVGLRRGSGTANAVLAWSGVAAGLLMVAAAVVPAVLYGLGIGD